ncbi:MAG: aminomethyl-transferring glycine dehydrogenase subunit GcvPB [Euryarchaeota archaeon]|nr:aminomethyl-transferring glycine dehydrogenase subunit GcvPB [Euryarchaeota archaeon]
MYRQAKHDDMLIFERAGESDFCFLTNDVEEDLVPEGMARKGLCLPIVPEREVVKHYTNLSQKNFGVDNGLYPLGSCTMKYNPKYADLISSMPSVGSVHPYQDPETCQGSLRLLYELEEALCAISDMDAVTLQPAAGAQGEFTGMLIAKAFHRKNGEERTEVVIPDTAHGTNPASAAMAGFNVIEVPSNGDGFVDMDALKAALSDRTAAFMITNPNTLGIFEPQIEEIAKAVHDVGALLYYDGANFNAIMGHTSPGKMDFDIVHFNLHKTFATPHGGGGPGAGPVGVCKRLEPFLPIPRIVRKEGSFDLDYERPDSIGKVRSFHGNFAVLVRAYAYILRNGSDGLMEVSQKAVLNSNYLKRRLEGTFDIPFGAIRKHEFVLSAKRLGEKNVRALDVAKRLLDHGFMSPTIYFPMLVDEAMMIEPTETESKETLDEFADAMIRIATEDDPEDIRSAPHSTSVGRIDELFAAKELVLSWRIYQRKKDRF